MALEIKQSLRMAQQLVVTPQLQQAIRLLQLSRMELTTMIQKELIENPCLEEEEEESETVKLETKEGEEESSHGEAHEQAKEADKGHEHPFDEVGLKDPEPKEPSNFDWENYLQAQDSPSGAYERNINGPAEELPPFENTVKKTETLQEHLLWQLGMTVHLTDEEHAIAEEIIGNINDDGYLMANPEEIAKGAEASPESVEAVLKKVQEFDPIGVAARDIQECLLLQARSLGGEEGELLCRIIQHHLKHLELHDYKPIAKALDVPIERVLEIEKMIHQLDPKPGRAYSNVQTQYITPDVFVTKRGDKYVVTLNEDGMPKLAVSPLYRRAILHGETVGVQAREYIQDKLRQALWLIKSIHQRQRTLYRVTQSIVKFQRDFFEKGPNHLRPMVLKDVAEDIGMHESTVSRVTTNKYAHTPRGLLELKYFFNSSLGGRGADGTASEVVKNHLQHLIAKENLQTPLSDQEIAGILKEKHNIDIARRTVAKYRETLGVLPSSRRRRKHY
ncbi:MAG: RNA polymerase factor sigma-54 [Deltaproteobacteria bacterium]|nr:RNA polymerase factor sigma-54 [Deltaproteobacteria bacterium]